ncbi:MAG: iron-siderophore ABC transporter substrate-binding protein [Actinomycetaceae bacterium]
MSRHTSAFRPSSTMRGLVLAAGVALALSACSSGGDDGSGDGSGEGAGEESGSDGGGDGGDAFPVTVETEHGDVTVEERPERVVALGWGDAEIALQLGVEPVGAADWIGFDSEDGIGPWVENTYSESPEILGTLELSYEAVAALEPDLILDVNSSGDEERHERLSSIATTVGVGPGGTNYLTNRDEQVEMIATALGEPERGEEILAEVDAAFAEVAEAHPEWSAQTATVASRTSEGWGAHTSGDGRMEFMEDLGFTPNPELEELAGEGEWSVSLSDEQIGLFDADVVVGFPIWIDAAEITEDAGWNAVPAVEDGRALVVGDDLSNAFSLGTPEARLYALEQLAPMIEEAQGEQ